MFYCIDLENTLCVLPKMLDLAYNIIYFFVGYNLENTMCVLYTMLDFTYRIIWFFNGCIFFYRSGKYVGCIVCNFKLCIRYDLCFLFGRICDFRYESICIGSRAWEFKLCMKYGKNENPQCLPLRMVNMVWLRNKFRMDIVPIKHNHVLRVYDDIKSALKGFAKLLTNTVSLYKKELKNSL